jgi:drug/metabolite transporter (DMT)-like permease
VWAWGLFIRVAAAPPLSVAALRMALGATLIALPTLIWQRAGLRALRRADARPLVGSGLLLAAHFAAFISSLSLTSVANAVFLVTTTPVFVALGEAVFLHQRPSRLMWGAVALSMAGGGVLALDSTGGEGHVAGDALALVGAATVSGYLLVGRRVRARMGVMAYSTVVNTVAALALAGSSPLTGLEPASYLWIGLVALVPQVIGHSLLNWSLAHVSATTVTLVVRAEPVVATLLAVPVLGEVPGWVLAPGAALILGGAVVAARAEGRRAV